MKSFEYEEVPTDKVYANYSGAEEWFADATHATAQYSVAGQRFPSARERLLAAGEDDPMLPVIGRGLMDRRYGPFTLFMAEEHPMTAPEVYSGVVHLGMPETARTPFKLRGAATQLERQGLLQPTTEHIVFLLRNSQSPETIFVSHQNGFQATPAGGVLLGQLRSDERRRAARRASPDGRPV
jgi:hypothetical protein